MRVSLWRKGLLLAAALFVGGVTIVGSGGKASPPTLVAVTQTITAPASSTMCTNPSGRPGDTMVKGGQTYRCECKQWIKGQDPVCVWRNIDATNFLTLSMARDTAIVNGKAVLIFQDDGNLVVYDETGVARWAASTVGKGVTTNFQSDGNFVVYNSSNKPVWASNTCCHSGNLLKVQGDGNVVIYNSAGTALWATHTNH
ncbi:MAG TPA: hypothetical protein VJT31_39815 [Rugosimonospora sp.]|nr:hypothetical protein [Rugosimonospora sp.]